MSSLMDKLNHTATVKEDIRSAINTLNGSQVVSTSTPFNQYGDFIQNHECKTKFPSIITPEKNVFIGQFIAPSSHHQKVTFNFNGWHPTNYNMSVLIVADSVAKMTDNSFAPLYCLFHSTTPSTNTNSQILINSNIKYVNADGSGYNLEVIKPYDDLKIRMYRSGYSITVQFLSNNYENVDFYPNMTYTYILTSNYYGV